MNTCKHCKKNFKNHPSKQSKGNSSRKICGACSVTRRRWISKLEMVESIGGKCSRCGYNKHPAALHFHHINPRNKKFSINSNKLLSKDRFKELKKCILLCANCHSIEHCNNKLFKSFGLLNKNLLD